MSETQRAAVGLLLLAAVLQLLHSGCTPITPQTVPSVNNITLNQRFAVGCSGGEEGEGGETTASDETALAQPGSVAISNDVWIAGTTARGAADAELRSEIPITASVAATGQGNASAEQTPAAPAAPARPRTP